VREGGAEDIMIWNLSEGKSERQTSSQWNGLIASGPTFYNAWFQNNGGKLGLLYCTPMGFGCGGHIDPASSQTTGIHYKYQGTFQRGKAARQ
jgi:hypothetical protein